VIKNNQAITLIAEISGNHLGNINRAKELIHAAKESGATHVKLQTYTPDTITLNVSTPEFRVSEGHELWSGRTLWDLYQEAHTPWEWHEELFSIARKIGVEIFSSPFDPTAVAFLEDLNVNLYKIASLETGDLHLIEMVAKTGKPLIISTGASTLEEIDDVVATVKKVGNNKLTLLLCTSAYPTPINGIHLGRLKLLQERYDLPTGLSDHTIGLEASIGAVALGATVIERHLTLKRSDRGADSAFSLEPEEFKSLAQAITHMSAAIGNSEWLIDPIEDESRRFRRSLYVTQDVIQGELLTQSNIRSVRPANGIAPKYLNEVLGKHFKVGLPMGTALSWDHFS
jgi:pseudaminic acid synthase